MAYADPRDPRALEAKRRHYEKNREAYLARSRDQKAAIREAVRVAKDVPCADCGGRFPYYVMEFDHLPGAAKRCDPAKLHQFASMRTAMEELAKCEVVCANCHRFRTAQRAGLN